MSVAALVYIFTYLSMCWTIRIISLTYKYVVICVTFSCIICFDVYFCLYDNLQTLEEIKLSSSLLLLFSFTLCK